MAAYRVIAGLALSVAPIALLSNVASQERTTFRSAVSVIEVDTVVTDGRGNPVRDLAVDDFELFEDGVAQRITQVSFVDLGTSDDVGADSQATSGGAIGRTVVLLLAGELERILRTAELFIEHGMGPGDRVAVVDVLSSAEPSLTFANDRAVLMAAIKSFVAARDPDLSPADGIAGRNVPAAAFRVAANIATQLGALDARRKAIVWIDPPYVTTSREPERVRAQRDALTAATRHNVAIYPVSTRGLSSASGSGLLEMTSAYRAIAEQTGGEAISNTNNLAAMFRRSSQSVNSYYLLTYQPAVEHIDGKFHQITIKVKRPGVRIRARSGYYAPGD